VFNLMTRLYVLLDEGVITEGFLKLLILSMVIHVLIKIFPDKLHKRIPALVAIIAVFLPITSWSLRQDFQKGWYALGSYYLTTEQDEELYKATINGWEWGDRRPENATRMLVNLSHRNQLEQAAIIADEILPLHPDHQGLLVVSSEIHFFLGNFERAVELARRSAKSDEPLYLMMRGYNLLVRALLQLKRFDEAVGTLREERERLPSMEARLLLDQKIASITAAVGSSVINLKPGP